MKLEIAHDSNDRHLIFLTTNGFVESSDESVLGSKADSFAGIKGKALEEDLVENGGETSSVSFARGEKRFSLINSNLEKVRVENDVGLVKEVIELGSEITSTRIQKIIRKRDHDPFDIRVIENRISSSHVGSWKCIAAHNLSEYL